MLKVIVNADDLGFSESINRGIFDSYKKGIVKSGTMMVNMPGFENAIDMFKDESEFGIGIHLNVTKGEPIGNGYVNIVDSKGKFKGRDGIEENLDLAEIEQEFNLQLKLFMEKIGQPTHIDSHHHIHRNKKLQGMVFEIAKKNNLPIRTFAGEFRERAVSIGLKSPDIFDTSFFGNPSIDIIDKIIKKYGNTQNIIEIMVHPGYMNEETFRMTSYGKEREAELAGLIAIRNSDLYDTIMDDLVNYRVFG